MFLILQNTVYVAKIHISLYSLRLLICWSNWNVLLHGVWTIQLSGEFLFRPCLRRKIYMSSQECARHGVTLSWWASVLSTPVFGKSGKFLNLGGHENIQRLGNHLHFISFIFLKRHRSFRNSSSFFFFFWLFWSPARGSWTVTSLLDCPENDLHQT